MRDDTLAGGLLQLRDELAAVTLSLPLAATEDGIATRDEAVAQIEDYLLPRLAHLDAPLLAVLGGSTGSGKSTLTNSLVGEEVSTAGVLRPTTRAPVLVHHPDDTAWFSGDGVLPDLPRTTGERGVGHALHLVASGAMTPGLGLLDSPDIDSIEVANHELAAQLLGAADLWLFVTTAARYADAVPWQYLARASERTAAVAVVVNRIPPTPDGSAVRDIAADVRRMLDANGLAEARLFTVTETPLVDGRLGGAEDEIRAWVEALVDDADARAATIRRTVMGAVDSLQPRVGRVMQAMREHQRAAESLVAASTSQQATTVDVVRDQLASGVLLRGEVLDRFREQVGTAEWMDRLQRGVGRLRDRIGQMITGRAPEVEAAKGQLRSNLVGLVDDAVVSGLERAVASWQVLPGGPELLAQAPDPAGLAAPDLRAVEDTVAAWQDHVVAMVRERAGSKIAVARGMSLGVNGVGVALMMAIFASTGGLTGGEVAVAGGTAAFGQAVLSAVFGEQAIRDLATAARTDLLDRVQRLAEDRHEQLRALLEGLPDAEAIRAMEDALDGVSR
ncbi:GTPase domain-containing protein [Euzebya pacifica]|uniref:GTPase domain-containing protein n=1 Tax=Euzebya pacifica TaxID=1608957 RepID=UPI0030F60E32